MNDNPLTLVARLQDLNRYTLNAPAAHKRISEAISLIESQQTTIAEMENANAQRKQMNAQMLMNAVESGNPNYQAQIESQQATITELSGAMYSVLEGWTIPSGARKILERAYYARATLKEKNNA